VDPLTLAGSFATVVGLLANFKAERTGVSIDDFMAWVREHHQDAVATSIEQNEKLKQALTVLLSINHQELVSRLHTITTQLNEIASNVEGFGDVARAMGGASPLSEQARQVLRQIAASPAKFVMQHKTMNGTHYLLVDGDQGEIQASEPRFLEEDFDALVSANFLRVEFTSKGASKYFITRAGTQAANAA